MNFIERKVSIKRAISILAKNEIDVDDKEAGVIIDFLYLMARNYSKKEEMESLSNPKELSNSMKSGEISP